MDWTGDRLQIPLWDWMEVFEKEYVADYLKAGGSTVKFLSASDATLNTALDAVRDTAGHYGYHFVHIDPSKPNEIGKKQAFHRIDELYFALTKSVDWKAWASEEARAFLKSRGINVASGRSLNDIDGIAEDNGRVVSDLYNQYQRDFATRFITDTSLAIEFRTALTALSRAQVLPDSMTPTTEDVLLNWLAGKSVPGGSAALKRIGVFNRIDLTNARDMLTSFCRWLPRTGRSGLFAVLDFRVYEHKPRTAAQRRKDHEIQLQEAIKARASHEELDAIISSSKLPPPLRYTDANYYQMLLLLRRFIDETDYFERFCLLVLTSPAFYDNVSERNYANYNALQTRIGIEVRDAKRANPLAALVHIGDVIDG